VKAAITSAIAETGAAGHEGHGQGDRGLEGEIRRPDGFRQGQRPSEGGADGVISRAFSSEVGPGSRKENASKKLEPPFRFNRNGKGSRPSEETMADQQAAPAGPDLSQGVALSNSPARSCLGNVGDEDVLLVRSGSEIFAVDAHCSHYHGPLAEGLVDGESIRCPWHHACFDLRTGEATRAPALNSIAVWKVEHEGNRIFVRQKREQPKLSVKGAVDAPARIVIVGGGAAGFAAAEMLRRQEYRGSIVMLSNEAAAPVDRPNLSKDYLAGSAPEDWLPLRPESFTPTRVSICGSGPRSHRSIPRREP